MIGFAVVSGEETVIAVSRQRRALLCDVEEINYLSGAGRGVTLIKLGQDDALLGLGVATAERDAIEVKTSMGGTQRISAAKYESTTRGGKGREVIKRGSFTEMITPAVAAPPALDLTEGET